MGHRPLFLVAMIWFLLPALSPTPAGARAVTRDEATTVAANFIEHMIKRTGGWGDTGKATVSRCNELKRGDMLLGYHISVTPKGYVVVSILTELPPVAAFSTSYDYKTDSEEGFWRMLKDAMDQTLQHLGRKYGSFESLPAGILTSSATEGWGWLLEKSPAPELFVTVGPLLQTQWHQDTPFDNYCPIGDNVQPCPPDSICPPSDGPECPVGCVATAAAQIMRYWKYPLFGDRDTVVHWNGDQSCSGSVPGRDLFADFSDDYDWAHMLSSYPPGGYDSVQAAAVAELCYEVGVAFQTDYHYCGSAATLEPGLYAFARFFRYKDSVTAEFRGNYGGDSDAWFNRIKVELDAQPPRPIHYSITGHALVCDGYLQDGSAHFVHMNYGWGGGPQDDWYSIDQVSDNPVAEVMHCGIEPAKVLPLASFTGSPTYGPSPLSVKFIDLSTFGPTKWAWDFGDGASSNQQSPTHVYSTPGAYTVRLTVTNAAGSDEEVRSNFIVVECSSSTTPVASFAGSPTNGQAPLSVSFSDFSGGSPTSWTWDFGDNSGSTERNPVHIYTNPGLYTVTLTVANNACGSDQQVRANYISVSSAPPGADFTAFPTSGYPPLTVSLVDLSTGNPASWFWWFGYENAYSTAQNPTHTFPSPGVYTVSLTVTNSGGEDQEMKENYITVVVPGQLNIALTPLYPGGKDHYDPGDYAAFDITVEDAAGGIYVDADAYRLWWSPAGVQFEESAFTHPSVGHYHFLDNWYKLPLGWNTWTFTVDKAGYSRSSGSITLPVGNAPSYMPVSITQVIPTPTVFCPDPACSTTNEYPLSTRFSLNKGAETTFKVLHASDSSVVTNLFTRLALDAGPNTVDWDCKDELGSYVGWQDSFMVYIEAESLTSLENLGDFGTELWNPSGMCIRPDNGWLYVTDYGQHKVFVYDENRSYVGSFGSQGREPGQFMYPQDVEVPGNGFIYVADTWYDNAIRIQKFDYSFSLAGPAQAYSNTLNPLWSCLTRDEHGYVWLGNQYVRKIDPSSLAVLLQFEPTGGKASGLTFDSKDRIYAVLSEGQITKVFDSQGNYLSSFNSGDSGYDPDAAMRLGRWLYVLGSSGIRVFDVFDLARGSIGSCDPVQTNEAALAVSEAGEIVMTRENYGPGSDVKLKRRVDYGSIASYFSDIRSNAEIECSIPSAVVLRPNGGELLYAGSQDTIRWTATDNIVGIDHVNIVYSVDGGNTFPYTVAINEPNGGSYLWTIPSSLSANCKVKVIAYNTVQNFGFDTSDNPFTIALPPDVTPPQVVLIEPNGGEVFYPGSQTTISWLGSDNVGVDSVNIYYSVDGITFPYTIATAEANDGIYTWTVPSTFSDSCKVKVVAFDAALNSAADESYGLFKVKLPLGGDCALSEPCHGSECIADYDGQKHCTDETGCYHAGQFTASEGYFPGQVLLPDSGCERCNLGRWSQDPFAGPAPKSTFEKLVLDGANPTYAYLTIPRGATVSSATMFVSAAGSVIQNFWVDIGCNGANWSCLASKTTLDDFEDSWSSWAAFAPSVYDGLIGVGSQDYVKEGVSSVKLDLVAAQGSSNSAIWNFTATPTDWSTITGVSSGTPTKGTLSFWLYASTLDYLRQTTSTIRFQIISTTDVDYVEYHIPYSSFALGWSRFEIGLASPAGSGGTMDWTNTPYVQLILNEVAGNTNNFSIYLDDMYLADATQSSLDEQASPQEIEFASDLQSIATDCACQGCQLSSDNCIIPIELGAGSAGQMVLDNLRVSYAFSDSTPPQVSVVSPNGGEALYAGSQDTIRWVSTDNIWTDSVSIYYSTDGGATFPYTIVTGEPDGSLHVWTVPDTTSQNCLIKVRAYDAKQNAGEDVSDAFFTILGTVAVGPSPVPVRFDLSQNYPNPFNPVTRIEYNLDEEALAHLRIYDLAGKAVRTLVKEWQPEGSHFATWDGRNEKGQAVASGIYVCRLEASGKVATRKVVLLK